jgi:hypothetical protein
MKVIMSEQEFIDATAIFGAREHRLPVDQISVELFYGEQTGEFTARLYQDGNNAIYLLTQQQLIDGVASYLRDYHRFDPSHMEIELFFAEGKGFSAEINIAK